MGVMSGMIVPACFGLFLLGEREGRALLSARYGRKPCHHSAGREGGLAPSRPGEDIYRPSVVGQEIRPFLFLLGERRGRVPSLPGEEAGSFRCGVKQQAKPFVCLARAAAGSFFCLVRGGRAHFSAGREGRPGSAFSCATEEAGPFLRLVRDKVGRVFKS